MDDSQEERARGLAEQLEKASTNCGLLGVQGTVVLRCPDVPYTDTAMMMFD